jgi:hypothetical protein
MVDANQIHRRRSGVFELFVCANRFSFRVRRELLYAVIYHPEGHEAYESPSGAVFDLMPGTNQSMHCMLKKSGHRSLVRAQHFHAGNRYN